MLILLIISFFFVWLIYREWKNPKDFDNFTRGYIAILAVLAILSAFPVVDHWRFESILSKKASILADNKRAKVKCATVFQSVYDKFGFAGLAYYDSGEIILQYPTCNELRDYLDSPETANRREIYSLNVFTHEAMHIRGERDEQKTECQAIQRYVTAAKLLGVRAHIAEQNAQDYYRVSYIRHAYFSPKCAPGKEYDENLDEAVW